MDLSLEIVYFQNFRKVWHILLPWEEIAKPRHKQRFALGCLGSYCCPGSLCCLSTYIYLGSFGCLAGFTDELPRLVHMSIGFTWWCKEGSDTCPGQSSVWSPPLRGRKARLPGKETQFHKYPFSWQKQLGKYWLAVYLFCKTFDGWSSSSPSKDFIALQLIFRLKISNIKSIYSSPIINLTIPTTHIWQNTSIQPYPLIPTRQSWQTHISWVSGVGSK